MHGTRPPKPPTRAITIRLARDPNDLMTVTAIRSAVYLAEQDCPIEEEFDGNDLCAAHFLGYIGNEPAAPGAEAIVIPKNSTIRSVADLKGKKVALNRGSNVHYLLVRALAAANLKYTDIQPVYLAPADARASG